jgi:hypothetical protein
MSTSQLTSLDSVKAEYRNLRENYEYRLGMMKLANSLFEKWNLS